MACAGHTGVARYAASLGEVVLDELPEIIVNFTKRHDLEFHNQYNFRITSYCIRYFRYPHMHAVYHPMRYKTERKTGEENILVRPRSIDVHPDLARNASR